MIKLYRKNVTEFFQSVGRGLRFVSHLLTCSPAHLHPKTSAPENGFTLVEVLITLVIIGLIGMTAALSTTAGDSSDFDTSYQATVELMEEIQKAVLGDNIPHDRGVQINGYVADMGRLPVLNDSGQPESLWQKPEGLAARQYYAGAKISTGWNGPYVDRPDTGILKDGWGSALFFEIGLDKSFTIISYGGDMQPGGRGPAGDIVVKIKPHQYMAPLGFSFRGIDGDLDQGASTFTIHYPDPETGGLASEELEMDRYTSGELVFGLFVSNGEKRPLYPIGLRSITATIKHGKAKQEKVIVFSVQPGMNYLGTIE